MRVHFICRGNAYRSRMAEAYLNSLELKGVESLSSGTVAEERSEFTKVTAANTLKFLGEKGLAAYAKHQWDQLTQERIQPDDITVCMNRRVRDECDHMVKLPPGTLTWDIDDSDEGKNPVTTPAEWHAYTEQLFEGIKTHVDDLVRPLIDIA